MTVRDVQRKAERIRHEKLSIFAAASLYSEVLQAIADSRCQDSPAELAAEALKVMDDE